MIQLCQAQIQTCPELPPVLVTVQNCVENHADTPEPSLNLYKCREELSTIDRPPYEDGWDTSPHVLWWNFDEEMDNLEYMPPWWQLRRPRRNVCDFRQLTWVIFADEFRIDDHNVCGSAGSTA